MHHPGRANWLRATGLPEGVRSSVRLRLEAIARWPRPLPPSTGFPPLPRELREVSRPLHSLGLGAQVPGQSQTSGSQARPPLRAPAPDPARAPSAPCRPQLFLAAPLRWREARGPPPACDFQSLPWEKGSAEEAPGGGHTAGAGTRRDCLLFSHPATYPGSRWELSGHESHGETISNSRAQTREVLVPGARGDPVLKASCSLHSFQATPFN